MLVTLNIPLFSPLLPQRKDLQSTLGVAVKQLMRVSVIKDVQTMQAKDQQLHLLISFTPTTADILQLQDGIYKLAALMAVHFIPTWFTPTNATPYGLNLGAYAYDYEPFDVVAFRFPQSQHQ